MSSQKKIPIPIFMCKKRLLDISISSGLHKFLQDAQFPFYRDYADAQKFYKENGKRYSEIVDKFMKEFVESQAFPAIKFAHENAFSDFFNMRDREAIKKLNKSYYKDFGLFFELKRIVPPISDDARHDFFPLVSIDSFLDESIDLFVQIELKKRNITSVHPHYSKIKKDAEQQGIDIYRSKHTFLNLIWNFPIFSHTFNYEEIDPQFLAIQKKNLKMTREVGLFGLWEQPDEFQLKLFKRFEDINKKIESHGGKIHYLQGNDVVSTDFNAFDMNNYVQYLEDRGIDDEISKIGFVSLVYLQMASIVYEKGDLATAEIFLDISEKMSVEVIDFVLHLGIWSPFVAIYESYVGYTIPKRDILEGFEKYLNLLLGLASVIPAEAIFVKLKIIITHSDLFKDLALFFKSHSDSLLAMAYPFSRIPIKYKWALKNLSAIKYLNDFDKHGYPWAAKARQNLKNNFKGIWDGVSDFPDENSDKFVKAMENICGTIKEIMIAGLYHEKEGVTIKNFGEDMFDAVTDLKITEIDLKIVEFGKNVWIEVKSKGKFYDLDQAIQQAKLAAIDRVDIYRYHTDVTFGDTEKRALTEIFTKNGFTGILEFVSD